MADRKIINPSLLINDETITYVPNSLKFKGGKGNRKVMSLSAGEGQTTTVFSDDDTTRVSMISFSVYATPDVLEKIITWQDNGNENGIVLVASGEFPGRSFNFMTLVTDPEVTLGGDNTIELEFQGDPAV